MPIRSFIDYLPVMNEFIIHWNATDDAILLPENGAASALSDFEHLRTALDGAKTSLQIKLTDLENSRVVLEQARPAAGPRVYCLAGLDRARISHPCDCEGTGPSLRPIKTPAGAYPSRPQRVLIGGGRGPAGPLHRHLSVPAGQ